MLHNTTVGSERSEFKTQAEAILQESRIMIPSRETIEAINEAREGVGKRYDSLDAMFDEIAADPPGNPCGTF